MTRAAHLATLALLAVTTVAMTIALWMVFLYAPEETKMAAAQRIFYFHVPAAIVCFLSVFVLLGAGAKPRDTGAALRLCPERWLGKATHDYLRESLAPLHELPVSRVLVSHGEPVLRGGARALAAALAG